MKEASFNLPSFPKKAINMNYVSPVLQGLWIKCVVTEKRGRCSLECAQNREAERREFLKRTQLVLQKTRNQSAKSSRVVFLTSFKEKSGQSLSIFQVFASSNVLTVELILQSCSSLRATSPSRGIQVVLDAARPSGSRPCTQHVG